jgi:hypothetical protein
MATETVRNSLVRVLLDPAFYDLITSSPEEALKGYDLTEQEKRLLAEPDASLYAYLSDTPKEVDIAPGDVAIEGIPIEDHQGPQLPPPHVGPPEDCPIGPPPNFGPLDLHMRDVQDKALEANPRNWSLSWTK